jgi:hypothetical protein
MAAGRIFSALGSVSNLADFAHHEGLALTLFSH